MKSTTTKNVTEDSKVVSNVTSESATSQRNCREINQIDIETGEIVQTWQSVYLAAQVLSIDRSSLTSCLRGSRKTAGGYKWEYVDSQLKHHAIDSTTAKAVYQCDLDGNIIKKFPSVRDAAGFYDYDINEIRACAKGGRTEYKGFIWKYVNAEDKFTTTASNSKAVYQCDMEGNIIKEFPTVAAAAASVNGSSCFICDCCRGIKNKYQGYKWKYVVEEPVDISKMRPGREIVQLDLDGNLVARYASLSIAAVVTKISDNSIRKVLRGDRNKTHDFIFMYADIYDAKK